MTNQPTHKAKSFDGTWSPDFSNTSDDANLILLAPSMREELLKMDEEMDELRQTILERQRQMISDFSKHVDEINHWRDRAIKAENQLNQPQP